MLNHFLTPPVVALIAIITIMLILVWYLKHN